MFDLFLGFGLFFAMVLVSVFLINIVDDVFDVARHRYRVAGTVMGVLLQVIIVVLLVWFILFAGDALLGGR